MTVEERLRELHKYAKLHIKCDCGHYAKDHYLNEGWCHHSEHPKAGQCGCTWYYPNTKWMMKQGGM